jgi:gluconokinase
MRTNPLPQPADGPLILTIDAGTSSTRARLYDAAGAAVPGVAAQTPHPARDLPDGAAEDDPDAALDRIFRCLDAALAQAGPLAARIAAVAVTTLATTFIALGRDGRPLTPLITYADTRNDDDAAALRRRLNERTTHQRTGCLLRTSYWPARLAWLRRTHPDVWRRAARFVTLGEYLELALFGRCRVSYSAASWTGLLNRHTLQWDAPLLQALDVSPEQLSDLADLSARISGMLPAHALRWPGLAGVPWLPAIGDGAAANIGSGCADEHRIALTVGTTGAVRVVLADAGPTAAGRRTVDTGRRAAGGGPGKGDDPEGQGGALPLPEGLWLYRVDGRRALLGGATSEGGNVFAWMRATLRLGPGDDLEAALAAIPPDSHGLTILPLFAGERSPGWAGAARAAITGLSLGTTPLEILRAGLEAVAYRFALIAAQLPQAGDAMFVASGGAILSSPAWLQIVADTLGRPVVASAEREASSRGAALLALEALGVIPSVAVLPAPLGATYTPDAARHAVYQAAVARQQRLYERLISRSDPEGAA